MSLIAELKRRNVFRVGIAYAVAAWVLLQVFDVLGEILELPAWGGKLILAMIVIGFFIALIVAWAYELTPEGVKRESEVDRSRSVTAQTGRKLNALIMALLIVAVAYLLFDKFWLQPRLQAAAGDHEAALRTMQQQVAHRHLEGWFFWERHRQFEPLWQDPRFLALTAGIRQEMAAQRENLRELMAAETGKADS
jgi:hypothetical protein